MISITGGFSCNTLADEADSEQPAGVVIATVERFSLGGDFIVEPTEVPFYEEDTYREVFIRLMNIKQLEYDANEKSSFGFYVKGIKNVDCGSSTIPACVSEILTDQEIPFSVNSYQGLSEFSYTNASGWMYYVNHKYVNGMSYEYPENGDVVRFMFTLCYGGDLTGTVMADCSKDGKKTTYYTAADKTALIRVLSEINKDPARWNKVNGFSECFHHANDVMAAPDALQRDVDECVNELEGFETQLPSLPQAIFLNQTELTVNEGEQFTLGISYTPDSSCTTVMWQPSDEQIVSFDGTVFTGLKEGTTLIKGSTINGLKVNCLVHVNGKKEADLATPDAFQMSINTLELKLEQDSYQIACQFTPVNCNQKLIWNSSNPLVATVDQQGNVTPVSTGTTTIRAITCNYLMDSCKVTVVEETKMPELKTPVITSVKCINYNTLKLRWNSVKNAEGYLIYRSSIKLSGYKKIASVSTTTYTDTKRICGRRYYYKVKAYNNWKGNKYYSNNSSVKSGKSIPETPVLKGYGKMNSVTLKWNKIAGATGYELFISTSKVKEEKRFVRITKGGILSYTKKNLTKNRSYYFTIRAYRIVNQKRIYGEKSSRICIRTKD